MPAPDPDAIHEVYEDGGVWRVTFNHRCGPSRFFPIGSKVGGNEKRNRENRARAIARRFAAGDWSCCHCGSDIGLDKRADAVYCKPACRVAACRAWKVALG